MLLVFKAVISGLIVAGVSELAKRSALWGAMLISVPLITLLTVIWMHYETKDAGQIALFLKNVFWITLPTLAFFLLCPTLLRAGMNFWLALGISLIATGIIFFAYAACMRRFGIELI